MGDCEDICVSVGYPDDHERCLGILRECPSNRRGVHHPYPIYIDHIGICGGRKGESTNAHDGHYCRGRMVWRGRVSTWKKNDIFREGEMRVMSSIFRKERKK